MNFLKNNIFIILAFALMFALSFVDMASADDVMSHAKTKAVDVFKAVKIIVFVIGGFGLIALAFQAIFGKVKWAWFAGLAFGLAILAAAGSIVNYATGATADDDSEIDLDDSFS